MAFGFPASHNERFGGLAASADPRAIVLSALSSLWWPVDGQSGNIIHASVAGSIWSWGESISVEFLPGGELAITSQCSTPQIFDWGKNEANVHLLISAILKEVVIRMAGPRPDNRTKGPDSPLVRPPRDD